MRKNLFVRSLLVGAATWMAGTAAFAGENWVGSWKLNAAKSDLGQSLIRAQALKFEVTPAGIALHSEGTDAKGTPMHAGYTSRFDGKDVPWPGNPVADTACPKKIDDNAYENVWKKAGKTIATARVAVSKDGKTLTITTDGTDAQGAKVHSVAVYDRQ
jgi:hypothetical protein